MSLLKGKVVVVTGGAGKIGEAFVKAIVEEGGIAIIGEFNTEVGESVKKSIHLDYKEAVIDVLKMDITSKDLLIENISYLNDKYGKIDALINCAYPRTANYGAVKLEDTDIGDFNQMINMNLGGYFLTSQQFANYFKKQGFGNIINVSSVYGVIPPKFDIYEGTEMILPVEYAMIKSSLIFLTKFMAKYFFGTGIRVNAISPGGIKADESEQHLSPQPKSFIEKYDSNTSKKGMLERSDLKGTIKYLLSDLSEYVTGQNIVVDDGFTL